MEQNIAGTDNNEVNITNLLEIQGQPQVTNQLKVFLHAHSNFKSATGNPNLMFGPVMLSGPSVTGKTFVAGAIHQALGNLRLI